MRTPSRFFTGMFGLALFLALAGPGFGQALALQRKSGRLSVRIMGRWGLPRGTERRSFEFEGRPRAYLLHIPKAYDGETPRPLVIVLHGGGANARSAVRMSGMAEKAEREGFFAAFPEGTGPIPGRLQTWNTWNCCGYALRNRVDDTAFLRAMIEKIEDEFRIDSKRVFAAGLSNGGMMAHRLGLELSERIAAIAPVAGALNVVNPRGGDPVSVIVFHGTADPHVRYEGGVPLKSFDRHRREDLPVSHAVEFWTKHNGCVSPVEKQETEGFIKETYPRCRNGTEVVFYTLKGQGHAWPAGATDAMWEFFSKHPKP